MPSIRAGFLPTGGVAAALADAEDRVRTGDVRTRDADGRTALDRVVLSACALVPVGEVTFDRALRTIDDLLAAGADPDGGGVAMAPLGEAIATGLRRMPSGTPLGVMRTRAAAVATRLFEAGASPVRRADLDAHPLLEQRWHLLGDVCAHIAGAMPAAVAWRWDVQTALLVDRPFKDRVAVAPRPGWRGVVDRLLGAAEREIGPTMGDLAWASGWAAAHPEHPQAMRLLAVCGGAS